MPVEKLNIIFNRAHILIAHEPEALMAPERETPILHSQSDENSPLGGFNRNAV